MICLFFFFVDTFFQNWDYPGRGRGSVCKKQPLKSVKALFSKSLRGSQGILIHTYKVALSEELSLGHRHKPPQIPQTKPYAEALALVNIKI